MAKPRALRPKPIPEVPLAHAPLARVIAQIRFPSILAIRNPDKVAVFQEALRSIYPHLEEHRVQRFDLYPDPNLSAREGIIWRLTDRETEPSWRVSLGVDFVALEASDYDSRADFLERLAAVVGAVEDTFKPADVKRLGLRYINRLTGEAVDRVGELLQSEVLGIVRADSSFAPALDDSIVHLMTEAQFVAPDHAYVQGRWGQVPVNATYDPDAIEPINEPSWVIDLDMFTSKPQSFESEGLLTSATGFATCLYWLFRQMVTDEFLRFYGGEL